MVHSRFSPSHCRCAPRRHRWESGEWPKPKFQWGLGGHGPWPISEPYPVVWAICDSILDSPIFGDKKFAGSANLNGRDSGCWIAKQNSNTIFSTIFFLRQVWSWPKAQDWCRWACKTRSAFVFPHQGYSSWGDAGYGSQNWVPPKYGRLKHVETLFKIAIDVWVPGVWKIDPHPSWNIFSLIRCSFRLIARQWNCKSIPDPGTKWSWWKSSRAQPLPKLPLAYDSLEKSSSQFQSHWFPPVWIMTQGLDSKMHEIHVTDLNTCTNHMIPY